MWTDTITPEDVRGRARVSMLATENAQDALTAARAIKHPWYRCQSLATVAENLDKGRRIDILREALLVAREQQEVNRVVSVSAWPMRVLAPAAPEFAAEQIASLVALANTEPHTLRRADALYTLARSVYEHSVLLRPIVPSLVTALLGGHGWRIDRIIRDSVELVRLVEPGDVARLVAHHSENRKKRQLVESVLQQG